MVDVGQLTRIAGLSIRVDQQLGSQQFVRPKLWWIAFASANFLPISISSRCRRPQDYVCAGKHARVGRVARPRLAWCSREAYTYDASSYASRVTGLLAFVLSRTFALGVAATRGITRGISKSSWAAA